MKLYLEISSLGAACGHLPFESIEKTLLHCWARAYPKDCKDFLIKSGYITPLDTPDLFKDHEVILEDHISQVSAENTKVNNFKEIVDKSLDSLKSLRNSEGSTLDLKEEKEFRSNAESKIKQCYGTNTEKMVISEVEAEPGNNKMYYYNFNTNWCIGGKHDATKNDTVLEIKSRTSYKNIRKNKYDLYQLYGYFLAMKKDQGKIIQKFENRIFDSDEENDREWGLIKKHEHNDNIHQMLVELYDFFNRLELIVKNKKMEESDIKLAIPDKFMPICNIDKDSNFTNKNFLFKRVINFL